MCGIAGIYHECDAPCEATLHAMKDCLTHRGPDEDGIYIDGPVG